MESEVALSPDCRYVAFSSIRDTEDRGLPEIRVLELATGTEVLRDKGRRPTWAPDGNLLAIARGDGVALKSIGSDQERIVAADINDVRVTTWSPNGRFVACESADDVVVIDAASGKVHVRIDGTPDKATTLTGFSLGDTMVAMVTGNGPYHWDVYVAQLDGGPARKLTAKRFRHGTAALSPDALTIFSTQSLPGGRGYGAFLLQVADGAQSQLADSANPGMRATWSPDGRFVVFADGDENVQLLHVRSGRMRKLTKMDLGYGPASSWFGPSAWFALGRPLPKVKGLDAEAK